MRWPPRDTVSRVVDVLLPPAVGLFLVLVVGEDTPDERRDWAVPLGNALGLLSGGALWWRRRHPEAVMAFVVVTSAALLLVVPPLVIPVAGLFAMFALASARGPRRSLPGLVALLGVVAINLTSRPHEDTAFTATLAVAAWALGEAARSRRKAIDEAIRRAALDEQARIARELHDVIAHSVSVIVVQASAADEVFERRPDQARAALRAIEATGREALAELRSLLASVRPADDAGDGGARQPQPGLARIDDLAEPVRAAGLAVDVQREGTVVPVPAGVDLAAYRVVQEALTNTVRHAAATRAAVTIRYGERDVEVDVRDDGRGAAAGGQRAGRGLAGMRERVAMAGGTLEAGPAPGGGFRVTARLPLGGAG